MENVQDVAAAIIDELGPIDAMKLQKLVYYSQAWSMAVTDRPLFLDEVQAWRDGPVTPNVYQNHKHLRKVRDWRYGDCANLSTDSRNLVSMVCDQYGHQSGDELSDLTHCESPWRDARGNLPEDASSNALIPLESMARFYRSNRTLGGRRAADLAAGGLVLRHQDRSRNDLIMDLSEIVGFGQLTNNYPAVGFGQLTASRVQNVTPVIGFGQRIKVDSERPSGFRPSRYRFRD